jgi:hypothetical protein
MVLRRAACVLLAAASFFAPPAFSTSFTTDQSDLWYILAESGWGIQLVQRGTVIFATMFVYGPSNTPTWYVATMQWAGNFTWIGDLYATTGPYFGTIPFDPATVVATKVGTMTWDGSQIETGVLSYTVNGVAVTKNVIRQTLVLDNYAGHYGGGLHQDSTGCLNPALNGTVENIGILNVTQNGAAITLQSFPATGGSCSYAGTLTQFGQMAHVEGSYTCSDGGAGLFRIAEMQVNFTGLTGRFSANSFTLPGCQFIGWFGGLRVTTF